MNPPLLSAVRVAFGLLFIQHGAEKLWGFAGGQIDRHFMTLHGFAGPLEVVGGTLIIFGLFTRFAAFILSGQMAVAYFDQWAGRAVFPHRQWRRRSRDLLLHVALARNGRLREMEYR